MEKVHQFVSAVLELRFKLCTKKSVEVPLKHVTLSLDIRKAVEYNKFIHLLFFKRNEGKSILLSASQRAPVC